MLRIIGDIDNIKAEIKQASGSTKEEIQKLKKKIKELQKGSKDVDYIQILDKKIVALNKKLNFYRSSHVLPVEVDGIVINYKVYKKYVELIKNLHIEEFMDKDKFIIKHKKGFIELYDISKYFRGFETVPKAVIEHDKV